MLINSSTRTDNTRVMSLIAQERGEYFDAMKRIREYQIFKNQIFKTTPLTSALEKKQNHIAAADSKKSVRFHQGDKNTMILYEKDDPEKSFDANVQKRVCGPLLTNSKFFDPTEVDEEVLENLSKERLNKTASLFLRGC